ncbi:MAG: glycerol-3-phosphate 1-O-acyltransferase PlsY [Lachnospiraceae bacterium]|nr:glycerol-3-phosphate 1-O-acyltransferase PlsY [Lachnospiraceae bacterium]
MQRLVCLAVGYLFGLFQTGYFVGLIKHRDIRNYGSGNSGTTNAMRVLGKKAGVMVFIGDFLKCVVACALVKWAASRLGYVDERMVFLLYAGLGVILGHNFPFYLNFKGGKGIAASWGLSLMVDWRLGLVSIVIFILIVVLTKYVSLASMLATAAFAVMWFVLIAVDALEVPYGMIESGILLVIVVTLAIVRHKGNIQRLIAGTENKIGQKVKMPDEEKNSKKN